MSRATTFTPLATYRNRSPYPFCPGCGHGPILDRLNQALVRTRLDPHQVVLVSDIGCSGLSDQYFATSAFHGLHGRSLTYATGIKLARPELNVIVLMGDGGTGIGGAHLLAAARRNIGLTLLVFNNFNYGMTGGQQSATTPLGGITTTTPAGNLERPLDLCATVAANGASWVYRGTSFDADLDERIAAAILHPGFALLDLWELCTAYFQPRNRWSKKSLTDTLEELGFATGLLVDEKRTEYAAGYRAMTAPLHRLPALPPRPLAARFTPRLGKAYRLVLAGSAGGRVGTAARLGATAAVMSGLWAAQRADYPVTVKSGHSVAELVLAPEPIDHAGIERPDAVVMLTPEGAAAVRPRLAGLDRGATVLTLPALAEGLDTPARVRLLDAGAAAGPRGVHLATLCLSALASHERLLPRVALVEAVRLVGRDEAALGRAVEAGWQLPLH